MPLYEYKCLACARHTEKRQKFSDPEITDCPSCGGPLERVITAPAISFKGGGWYADGYGNAKPKSSGDGKSEAPASDAPAAGAPTGGPTGSTDGKDSPSKPASPTSSESSPAAPTSTPAPATSAPTSSPAGKQ